MLSVKVHLLDSCLQLIEGTSNHLNTILADIFFPAVEEKIGQLELSVDSQIHVPNSPVWPVPNVDNSFTTSPYNEILKRKPPSNQKLATPKKPKVVPQPINRVTGPEIPDSLVLNKASPDSLINITPNLTTGLKSFQCSICNYVTGQKGTAKRHIELKHLPKDTVFKCQLCDYVAHLKFNLKGHYVSKHSLPEQAAKAMLD